MLVVLSLVSLAAKSCTVDQQIALLMYVSSKLRNYKIYFLAL